MPVRIWWVPPDAESPARVRRAANSLGPRGRQRGPLPAGLRAAIGNTRGCAMCNRSAVRPKCSFLGHRAEASKMPQLYRLIFAESQSGENMYFQISRWLRSVYVMDVVICEPIRTPVGRMGGALAQLTTAELATSVLTEL